LRSRSVPHRAIWACAALAWCGCAGKGIEDPVGPPVSCTGGTAPFRANLSCIQQIVFTPTCAVAGCHVNPGAQQGLDLSEGMAWSSLTGVPSAEVAGMNRVTAGDPDQSYLIWKLEGNPGIVGDRMPQGGPYLSQAEIDVIRRWILDGAMDD
jgi:hypothetical protein